MSKDQNLDSLFDHAFNKNKERKNNKNKHINRNMNTSKAKKPTDIDIFEKCLNPNPSSQQNFNQENKNNQTHFINNTNNIYFKQNHFRQENIVQNSNLENDTTRNNINENNENLFNNEAKKKKLINSFAYNQDKIPINNNTNFSNKDINEKNNIFPHKNNQDEKKGIKITSYAYSNNINNFQKEDFSNVNKININNNYENLDKNKIYKNDKNINTFIESSSKNKIPEYFDVRNYDYDNNNKYKTNESERIKNPPVISEKFVNKDNKNNYNSNFKNYSDLKKNNSENFEKNTYKNDLNQKNYSSTFKNHNQDIIHLDKQENQNYPKNYFDDYSNKSSKNFGNFKKLSEINRDKLNISYTKNFLLENYLSGLEKVNKEISDLKNNTTDYENDDINKIQDKYNEKVEMKKVFEKTFLKSSEIISSINSYLNISKKTESNLSDTQRDMLFFLCQVSDRENNRLVGSLPIYGKKTSLLEMIQNNRTSIVLGETGSGKSTQIAQYLYEEKTFSLIENLIKNNFNTENLEKNQVISISQPRRLATKTLSIRVAEEMYLSNKDDIICRIGKRSYDNYNETNHIIEFCTDTVLVEEILSDNSLSKYSHILIDEAHERNIFTDILLGLLKYVLEKRKDIKIIITSATMDENLFSKFFDNAPVIKIKGRVYPLKINYLNKILDSEQEIHHYITKTTVDIVNRIYQPNYYNENEGYYNNDYFGHILIFTSGMDEINKLTYQLNGIYHNNTSVKVLPLHGKLTSEEQLEVFKDGDYTKIILATRIAETSITINNVRYAIDVGFDKESNYDSIKKLTVFRLNKISQSSANQRAGRACRTAPGECYRLYSIDYYDEMDKFKIPEIKRSNLSIVILKLKIFNIENVRKFDFIEHPGDNLINDSLNELKLLEALEEDTENITLLGKEMAELPTDPWYSKILIESGFRDCQDEAIRIISMLQQHNLFYEPKNADKKKLDEAKLEFADETGDLIMLLNIFNKFWDIYSEKNPYFTYNKNKFALINFCKEKFLNMKAIFSAIDFYNEIKSSLKSKGIINNIINQKKKEYEKNLKKNKDILDSNSKEKLSAQDMLDIYQQISGNKKNTSKNLNNLENNIVNNFDNKKPENNLENFNDFDFNLNLAGNNDFNVNRPIEEKIIINSQENLKNQNIFSGDFTNCFKTEDNFKIKILKCFLSSCFQNLCVYSTNEEIGYTLIREYLPLKIHDQTSFKLHQNFPKWIFCINISNSDNLNSGSLARIASKCEISWIEETVPKKFLDYYNIKNYDTVPVYNSVVFENVPNFYLKALKNPINFKIIQIEEFFSENKFFTKIDYSNNILKLWSVNCEDYIRKKWQEFYEIFKREMLNMTREFVYLENRKVIFQSGLQVSEILTKEDFIGIKLTINNYYSEKIIRFVNDKNILNRKIKKISSNYDQTDEITFNCPDTVSSNKLWSLISDFINSQNVVIKNYTLIPLYNNKNLEDALFSNKIKVNVRVIFFTGYSLLNGHIKLFPQSAKRLKTAICYPENRNFLTITNEESFDKIYNEKDKKTTKINFQMGFLMDDQYDIFEKLYNHVPGLRIEDIIFYRCSNIVDVDYKLKIDLDYKKKYYELYSRMEKCSNLPKTTNEFLDFFEKKLNINLSEENVEIEQISRTNQLLGNVVVNSNPNYNERSKSYKNQSEEDMNKIVSFNVKTLKFANFLKEKIDKKMGVLGMGKIHVLISYKLRLEIEQLKFLRLESTLEEIRKNLIKLYPNSIVKIVKPKDEVSQDKNSKIIRFVNPKYFINIINNVSMQDVIECNEEFEKVLKGRLLFEYDYNRALCLFTKFSFLNNEAWENKYKCYLENSIDYKEIRICGDPENVEKGLADLFKLIENSKYENRIIDYRGKNISNLLKKKNKLMNEIKNNHKVDFEINIKSQRFNISGLIQNVKDALLEIEKNIFDNPIFNQAERDIYSNLDEGKLFF